MATMLDEEDTSTSLEPVDSTEKKLLPETTHSSIELEPEQETTVVLITARPQYFASTSAAPELLMPPQSETETKPPSEEPETTELPYHTQFLLTTPMAEVEPELETEKTEATTSKPSAEANHVVKLEPLYADVPEAVVAELTEQPEESTTSGYYQQQLSAEATTELVARLPVSESTTAAEGDDDDSTEVTP